MSFRYIASHAYHRIHLTFPHSTKPWKSNICNKSPTLLRTSQSPILIGIHWSVVTLHASLHGWYTHKYGALHRIIITSHASIKIHIKAYSIIRITSTMSHPHMKTIIVATVNYSTLVNKISSVDFLVDLDKRFPVKPRHHVFFSLNLDRRVPC